MDLSPTLKDLKQMLSGNTLRMKADSILGFMTLGHFSMFIAQGDAS
jgi:hypothetical protein